MEDAGRRGSEYDVVVVVVVVLVRFRRGRKRPPHVGAISGGGREVGRRLMRIAGSPLGQPLTGIGGFIVLFFSHPEK
ncbi:hypothetical protein EYF80_010300 [Liparis tanakae]|uniref:Uncharacterized protein n=1 Tax=Liparis tanakae TaxID=230148 RepID=A0A4Z2INQ2_9TELE|nr:hypothetical protein EYF80_010300 [Liparis tanakae]